VQTRPFGHGIILLNPAVEANKILQLKEAVAAEECYAETQPKLLHVLSSEADTATNIAFRAGQYLGVSISNSEVPLPRTYKGKPVTLYENDLDTTTIGNYLPFRTGRSVKRGSTNSLNCEVKDGKREECYIACKKEGKCLPEEFRAQHIPVGASEPLHFLYTDSNFIKDHNDVFNADVGGYIAAVVKEGGYKRMKFARGAVSGDQLPVMERACLNKAGDDFDFPHCFDHYKSLFEQKK
jgi:hypothetical protein